MKDYIQPFKRQLIGFLKTGKFEQNFIFYVVYKDKIKKFMIDFKSKRFGYIVDTVLYYCISMALDNNCDLEELHLVKKLEVILI